MTMMKSSVSEVKIQKCSYKWTIKNFAYLNKMSGEEWRSPYFSLGTEKEPNWFLILHSNGTSISVYLDRIGQYYFQDMYTFAILNNEGEKFGEKIVFADYAQQCQTERLGYEKFVSFDQLADKHHGLMPNGSLTILCEVVLNLGIEHNSIQDCTEQQSVEMPKSFQNLLLDERFSDVELVTSSNEKLRAHKCVLSAFSSTFSFMLKHDTEVLLLKEIEYDALEAMVWFIYGRKLNVSVKLSSKLLVAADVYKIEGLKEECLKRLAEDITVDSVVEILLIPDRYNNDHLKTLAMNFIKEHFKDIVETAEFRLLSQEKKIAFFNEFYEIF